MKKPWSISTTVRNPERIIDFLKVLEEFEGRVFDVRCQIDYQTALIKNKLYKPNNLPPNFRRFYENPDLPMPNKIAKDIFTLMLECSEELRGSPGLRGRTSVAPVCKMGLAIAKQSLGKVIITQLGKAFIRGEADLGDVFFRYCLKWQYPNPYSDRGFTEKQGFDIKPFIATLHIINRVNKIWKKEGSSPVGLSRDEFNFFVPTTISYKDIDKTVANIIKFRKQTNEQRQVFVRDHLVNFFETTDFDVIETQRENLIDYGDNTRRYFRLTRFFYIRGAGYYFDLEPRRHTEIGKLLETFDGSADIFADTDEYLTYLADIIQPFLPWETDSALTAILDQLMAESKELTERIKAIDSNVSAPPIKPIFVAGLSLGELKIAIDSAKDVRHELQLLLTHLESQINENFERYITELENIHIRSDQPITLEYLISLALFALNDAINIKPNYLAGDDNLPIFTAPAGVPDIECFYNDFNLICEVTMLRNRSQWFNEGQPVMRHLRDFETQNPRVQAYCLFIAPSLHRDTINTFWTACKYEYEGKKMRIVPFSLNQFINVLRYVLDRRRTSSKRFTREEIKTLLDEVMLAVEKETSSTQWLSAINGLIDSWGDRILNERAQ